MPSLSDFGLIQNTGEHRVRCPECDSRKKTLGVNTDEGFYHCFRCGWKGRVGDAEAWYGKHIDSAEFARRKAKQEIEKNELQKEAAKRAAYIWKLATPAPSNHPYLVKKGIEPHGIGVLGQEFQLAPRLVRLAGNLLVIPAYDNWGRVWWGEFINEEGRKAYFYGPKRKGCFYRIGDSRDEVFIVEGFATGASLHEQSGKTVLIAFDTSGLSSVVEAARMAAPDASIKIMADDDDAGLKAAHAAVEGVAGARVVVPDFSPVSKGDKDSDYNDLMRLRKAGGTHADS